jgi:hypothetical protein
MDALNWLSVVSIQVPPDFYQLEEYRTILEHVPMLSSRIISCTNSPNTSVVMKATFLSIQSCVQLL